MSVPRSRVLDLMKAQCRVFATTYNPQGLRLGNKVLRQRLIGPAVAAYYPRRMYTWKEINKNLAPFDLETFDEDEEDRLENVQILKSRGKGPPKKKRVKDESRGGKRRK